MSICEKCHEFIYSFSEHKCPPKWLCRIGEDEEEFCYEIFAYDSVAAAEKIVDREESNWDYSFVEDGGVDVDVKNIETGEVKKFYVDAEASISYSATERES